jgi:hypothetical protein
LDLTDTPNDVSAEVCPKVNGEKTTYMLMPHHQNAGQNHNIKLANRSDENVAQFKFLKTTVTNQNLIQEEIKRKLNSYNACYHLVQNLLSSHLLPRNVKIRIHNTTILPVVLYGCETRSLTLREKHRMRVFEKWVLRILGLNKNEMTGHWRKLQK